jgi:hypothetical protein
MTSWTKREPDVWREAVAALANQVYEMFLFCRSDRAGKRFF